MDTPTEKICFFLTNHHCDKCVSQCFAEFTEHLKYSVEEMDHIEKATRGQNNNKNWHLIRKGLITSSTFKTVLHSTDYSKTASSLLQGSTLNEHNLRRPISFGRKFEEKARQMCLKAHLFQHKKCSISVPGIIISPDTPLLAASPDGILSCIKCGQSLVEVKCLWSMRNFHAMMALLLSGICEKDPTDETKLRVINKHQYYYQMQGQMACTGVKRCFLVAFTYKSIQC